MKEQNEKEKKKKRETVPILRVEPLKIADA
jgi:hypothetical protein